jgi:alkylation response protein AidB-like acyl-CoA dehydrogenase
VSSSDSTDLTDDSIDDSTDDLLRDAATDFLNRRTHRGRLRGWIEKARGLDRGLWQEASALGWTALLLPEGLGGLGMSAAQACTLCEVSGQHLFGEPLALGAIWPAALLAAAQRHGADEHRLLALADAHAQGLRPSAVAWQEAAGQLELAAPTTQVAGGRLVGRKRFVLPCDSDTNLLVWACVGDQPAWVWVPASTPGVSVAPVAAGLGSQATMTFENVAIDTSQILLTGAAARASLAESLTLARLALAAELVGLAAGCLELTLTHLRQRQQFGRPLGSFQATQHGCVDLYLELELARSSLAHALSVWSVQGPQAPETDAAASAAKARAGETAVLVGRRAVQWHGAMGFCEESDVGLYLRAALHANALLGHPVALRRRFAALHHERELAA